MLWSTVPIKSFLSAPTFLPHLPAQLSNQCSTTGVAKAVVCAILSGMVHIKEPLLLIEKSRHVAAAGFLSRCLNEPLLYVRRYITVNKMY